MNKIWITIICISIIFGIINNTTKDMVENLFMTPNKTLSSVLKISSMLVIYNGLFQIAIDANLIKKISKIIIKPVKKLFKLKDEEINELICASIIANLLGLGPANMTLAMKIIERINNLKENKYYSLTMYLLLNISSLCVLPLSTLTLRATFNATINLSFIYMLFISSFLTTIFAITLVKLGKYDE